MSEIEAGVSNPAYSKNGDADSIPESDRKKVDPSQNPEDIKVEVEKGAAEQEGKNKDALALKMFTEEEEKILEVLREVVRKCTNPDPMKRPTAGEVMEMLDKCPVK